MYWAHFTSQTEVSLTTVGFQAPETRQTASKGLVASTEAPKAVSVDLLTAEVLQSGYRRKGPDLIACYNMVYKFLLIALAIF